MTVNLFPGSERVIPSEPISFLMPISNEVAIVENVVDEWHNDVLQYLHPDSELLFDEAGSTDGTREKLELLCKKYPYIRVTYNETKDGFAAASRRLYRAARCPLVFFTDSDGQYVPSEFWKLTPFTRDYPIVHGAKIGRQDPLFRKVASAAFNRICRVTFDLRSSDINSAFRLLWKSAVDAMLPRLTNLPTLLNAELTIRAELENLPIKQVFVIHRARANGTSRALPAVPFLFECVKTYKGVMALKSEYRK